MPKHSNHFVNDPPSAVDRACTVARNLFNAARGNYETDSQAVDAIARKAQLSPAVYRRFLQPSRRPKDVSLSVWQRLLAAYRRFLERRLVGLRDEIDRLDHLEPSGSDMLRLLDEAKALHDKIAAVARSLPSE